MVNKKELSVLIVDDEQRRQENLSRLVNAVFPNQYVKCNYANSTESLKEKLDANKYELVLVDFCLNESSEGWKMDAINSAMLISRSQPDCIRIGISSAITYQACYNKGVDGENVKKAINDFYDFVDNGIYHILLSYSDSDNYNILKQFYEFLI